MPFNTYFFSVFDVMLEICAVNMFCLCCVFVHAFFLSLIPIKLTYVDDTNLNTVHIVCYAFRGPFYTYCDIPNSAKADSMDFTVSPEWK